MRIKIRTRHKSLLFYLLGLGVAGFMLALVGFGLTSIVILLGLVLLLLRYATKPLALFIARAGYSIRFKFEIAIAVISVLFLLVSLFSFGAMDFMHEELHDIQELGITQPFAVLQAVDDLENTQHSLLFELTPILSVASVLLAAVLGAAMAWSVIDPVGRMGQAMRRIASGDFSEPVSVVNRDELGELADRINDTAQDLGTLQEASLAEERTRALREQISRVTMAQEEERRRISRELHDGLGPSLAAIGNRLRVYQSKIRTDPEGTEQGMIEITASLKGHVQEIRELIYDLRPMGLDQYGLLAALSQHSERFMQDTGIETSFATSGDVVLDPLAEVTVFRIVQECLSNVQKHASASRVEVIFQGKDTGLEVCVKDNGLGFNRNDTVTRTPGGVGLLSMHERADLVGGTLTVQSSPGGGCQVVLQIPPREVEVGADSSLAG